MSRLNTIRADFDATSLIIYQAYQVGLGRSVIEQFVEEWTQEISDLTPQVRRIHALLTKGNSDAARRLLPLEKVYAVEPSIMARLHMK